MKNKNSGKGTLKHVHVIGKASICRRADDDSDGGMDGEATVKIMKVVVITLVIAVLQLTMVVMTPKILIH